VLNDSQEGTESITTDEGIEGQALKRLRVVVVVGGGGDVGGMVPSCIRGRIEKGVVLPIVEVVTNHHKSRGRGGKEGEVLDYAIRGMKAEIFLELVGMMHV